MMNKELLNKLRDHKFYLENFCKVKTKDLGLQPFILNDAQKDFYNTLRKNNKVIILKARQLGFCLSPETRILTDDFTWKKIDEIKIGQKLVSVDENVNGGRGSSRKMRTAIVENKFDIIDRAFKVVMDNGIEIVATGDHRFLFKVRGAVHTTWRKIKDAKIGDEVRLLSNVWDNKKSFEDGWFSGMIDGEGNLCKKSRTGSLLSVSQVDGPVWEKLVSYAIKNNIKFRIERDNRVGGKGSKLGNKPVNKLVIGQMSDIFKIFGKCRPIRMISRDWWEGKKLPGNGNSWSKILSIEEIGERRMVDLQTSEKTFIAEGFVSHNSTGVTGFFYIDTIMRPGVTTALIGYNSDMVTELLDKIKTFYRTTPASMRPTIQYDSKYQMSFPAMDSKILVLPNTKDVGRGYSLQNCLITELSSWDDADEKFGGLMESITPGGRVVIESTPRGAGNLYHRLWMTDNEFVKKQYGWWWGYTKEQMDVKKRVLGERMWLQEYGLEFLTTGRNVFDVMSIRRMRKHQLKVGDINKGLNEGDEPTIVREEEGWIIYRDPKPGELFVCGGDSSEGVGGGDNSVAVIFNRKTGEEVAMYRGLIAPDRFGVLLDKWGRKYNNAFMAVEVNNHGLTTITILRQKIYPSLYFRPSRFESLGGGTTDRIGWKTTVVTRPLLIDELAQAVRDDGIIIHSKKTLDEMSVFVYNDNGDMVPQPGFHDDAIFATGIALQAFKILYDKPLTQIDESIHLPKSFAY